MFDDQSNQPNSNIPPNLPVGEPEDIFAAAENNGEARIRATGDALMDQTSALEAGVLRPKTTSSAPRPAANNFSAPTAPAQQFSENYDLKEPGIGKFLFKLFIILIVLAVLGGGGWFAYSKFFKQDIAIAPDAINSEGSIVPNLEEVVPADNAQTEVSSDEKISEIAEDIQDDEILFGVPVDKDGDNIDDVRETQIGTNPNNWDTDGDELSDGDEILVWMTDPLKTDSDGDSYLDGAEIKNGYNPRGPGKLFGAPTSTTSTASVSSPVGTSTITPVSTATSSGLSQVGVATSSVSVTTTVKK